MAFLLSFFAEQIEREMAEISEIRLLLRKKLTDDDRNDLRYVLECKSKRISKLISFAGMVYLLLLLLNSTLLNQICSSKSVVQKLLCNFCFIALFADFVHSLPRPLICLAREVLSSRSLLFRQCVRLPDAQHLEFALILNGLLLATDRCLFAFAKRNGFLTSDGRFKKVKCPWGRTKRGIQEIEEEILSFITDAQVGHILIATISKVSNMESLSDRKQSALFGTSSNSALQVDVSLHKYRRDNVIAFDELRVTVELLMPLQPGEEGEQTQENDVGYRTVSARMCVGCTMTLDGTKLPLFVVLDSTLADEIKREVEASGLPIPSDIQAAMGGGIAGMGGMGGFMSNLGLAHPPLGGPGAPGSAGGVGASGMPTLGGMLHPAHAIVQQDPFAANLGYPESRCVVSMHEKGWIDRDMTKDVYLERVFKPYIR